MTNNEGIVKKEQQTSMQNLGEIDFNEYFSFEKKVVPLGKLEVWHLQGNTMLFGKGAMNIASQLGIEYLMPEKIIVDDEEHSNPYIVYRDGKPVTVYIVKHGIAIAKDGIRYMQPRLDIVDLESSIANMAIGAQKKLLGTANACVGCTRAICDKLNDNWAKIGDPQYFFIPTVSESQGLAFNLSEKGDAGVVINKLQTDIIQLRRNPLRKIQTATNRLVLESLFPDVLQEFSDLKIGSYNKVESVNWHIDVPTKSPIAKALLIEFGIALRNNNQQERNQKFGEISNILGGGFQVNEVVGKELSPEYIEQDTEPQPVIEILEPDPCPANPTLKEFFPYLKSQLKKISPTQKDEVLAVSGCPSWSEFKLNKANKQPIVALFQKWFGIAPPEKPDPNMIRNQFSVILEQSNGFNEGVVSAYNKFGIDPESDLSTVADDTIVLAWDFYEKSQRA